MSVVAVTIVLVSWLLFMLLAVITVFWLLLQEAESEVERLFWLFGYCCCYLVIVVVIGVVVGWLLLLRQTEGEVERSGSTGDPKINDLIISGSTDNTARSWSFETGLALNVRL